MQTMRAPPDQRASERATGTGQHRPTRLPAPLRPLSTAAVQLLEVAAVFDGPFSVEDVAEVLGEPVGQVLPALREALTAAVIVPQADLIAYGSQQVRKQVATGIPQPIRLSLHRQVGAVLLARGESAVRAVPHLVEGVRPGDRQTLAALDQATRELTTNAPKAAADLALHVMRLTDPTDGEHLRRSETAIDALVATRRVADAERLARDVLDHTPSPARSTARIRLTLAGILFISGQPKAAMAEAEAVLATRGLPDELYDAAEPTRLHALLALHDVVRAKATAEAILAGDARGVGDTALAAAIRTLACIAWDQGRAAAAVGLARAAVRRAARAPAPRQHPDLGLASMLIALGEFDEAAGCLKRMTDAIERLADPLWEIVPPLFAARLGFASGQLDDALAHARIVLEIAAEAGTRMFVPPAYATVAQVAVMRGDLREASEYAERCQGEPAAGQVRLGAATYAWTHARVAEAEGGPAAAMAVLAEQYEALPTEPILLVEEPCAASWLTRVALGVGDPDRAEMVAACAEQLAANNPELPSIAAAATHARGLMDRDAAALERAATSYRHPWAAASALEDAGVARCRDGDQPAARGAFSRALTAYNRAGAERDAARLRARLRDVGVRPCHWTRAERPATGWPSLTETERQVARVVSEGLTNAQAAERLFLSRHTIDFHLRKIFRKLGVHSRTELARLVLQHAVEPGTP
jgi:DNA-binding CsgD family transcriptional regulator